MEAVFVTGGTGHTGANVCELLIHRGDAVKALVGNPDEAEALAAIGVELVQGDVTQVDDVLRAVMGCDGAIHCAALLGGATQASNDCAMSFDGTTNVLDAGEAQHAPSRRVEHRHVLRSHVSRPPRGRPVKDDPPDYSRLDNGRHQTSVPAGSLPQARRPST